MPSGNKRVKRETRVPKIRVSRRRYHGRLKETELAGRGSPKDMQDASQVLLPSVGQSRWDSTLKPIARKVSVVDGVNHHCNPWIPVVGKTGKPLMPLYDGAGTEYWWVIRIDIMGAYNPEGGAVGTATVTAP